VANNLYYLICTFDGLSLSFSPEISPNTAFQNIGTAINTSQKTPPWSQNIDRWAPENMQVLIQQTWYNFIFVSDAQTSDGKHRTGWVSSSKGVGPNMWDNFAPNFMNLGMAPGGDIDAHVFHDEVAQKYYLIWKTDDNSVGMTYTRIWGVEIAFSTNSVNLVGAPVVILDSTGMWWSNSWVNGGSLVEGPEIVKNGEFYYLFFASGRYCESSYMEGVARSKNVFGPYEKMKLPLLSTGIVGISKGQKLLGPGHASYVRDLKSNAWNVVWHASVSVDSTCNRFPFVSRLTFGSDFWPYADF